MTLNIPLLLRPLLLIPSLSPYPHLSPPSTLPLPPSPSTLYPPPSLSLRSFRFQQHTSLWFSNMRNTNHRSSNTCGHLCKAPSIFPHLLLPTVPPLRIAKAAYIHLHLELNACLEPYALSSLAQLITKLTS